MAWISICLSSRKTRRPVGTLPRMVALSSLCRPGFRISSDFQRQPFAQLALWFKGRLYLGGSGFFKQVTAAVLQYSSEHICIVGSVDRITRQGRAESRLEPERGCEIGKDLIDCCVLRRFGFLVHLRPLLRRSPEYRLPRRWGLLEPSVAGRDNDDTQHNTRRR